MRKMIFGGYDDHCVLSIHLPGEVKLGEAHLVRTQAALHEEEGLSSKLCVVMLAANLCICSCAQD